MSRIGKKPICVPKGVTVLFEKPRTIIITGPKGTLRYSYNREIDVTHDVEKSEIHVAMTQKTKESPAFWGTVTRLIANMIVGVTEGFSKKLELNGVGYRMALQGKKLNLALGFSHPVEVVIPEDMDAKVEANVLTLSGIDKQRVGQLSAEIRQLRPVEPYKGKGFRYVGEHVRKKEGKKAGS